MDRPGFKPGGWRHASLGGFDSHFPPPHAPSRLLRGPGLGLWSMRMWVAGCEFPDDLHYLVAHQTWARLDADGTARVGITAMGIRQAGEIYMCRPKSVGSVLEQGRSVAVVELAKSIVSVKSPVSGEVLQVNPRLEEEPELVHTDPYGEGWLAHVRVHDPAVGVAQLVHGDAVAAAMAHHAWLNQVE